MSLAHPCGIQPWGNSFLDLNVDSRRCRAEGLGMLSALSDELLLEVLGLVDGRTLGRLACASQAGYAFAVHDDLYRALVLTQLEGRWHFHHNWRHTYIHSLDTSTAAEPPTARPPPPPVSLERRLYSDVLYQPWFCATVPLRAEWLEVDNVDRRQGLSVEEFQRCYERPNLPVVLTDIVSAWPATRKWSRAYLTEQYGDRPATVGGYDMSLPLYLRYSDQAATDDQPLYLFDKHFARRAPKLAADFIVPEYFNEDLFSCLGEEERPDYRWLIIGPPRSGSSFHKDPNCTSAWNAVVSGSKRWVLFPPTITPPGIHPSHDGSDVAAPVSLIEWYLNFYEEARAGPTPPLECTCGAGDLIFVPRGWWHMVLNLEESVAVTQNFVSSVNLRHVLTFLRTQNPELVSGCRFDQRASLHHRFEQAMDIAHPKLMKQLAEEDHRRKQAASKHQSLASLFQADARAAPAASGPQDTGSFGFNFAAPADSDAGGAGGFRFNFGDQR